MWAYFDMFVGVSGDMILGALVDVGLPVAELERVINALGLSQAVSLQVKRVRKGALVATKVTVVTHGEPDRPHAHLRHVDPSHEVTPHPKKNEHLLHHHEHPHEHHLEHTHAHRTLAEILKIIRGADLPEGVKEKAARVFRRLAEAEARVHGLNVEEVHFHEVGALDAIVDIVATVAGLHVLGVSRVMASPFPVTHGFVETAHGTLPVPAPATAVLLEGAPVRALDIQAETVTPTGVALITTLADAFVSAPSMQVTRVGYGAGTMELPVPNVLRLWLGQPQGAQEEGWEVQPLVVLSTNVDDMPGEWFGPLFDALFAAGALDVWFTPIHMKKGRPGILITALTSQAHAAQVRHVLLRETTTLGVREMTVTRWCVPRDFREVETRWGKVRVKVAHMPDGTTRAVPEFEDCRALAQAHRVPLMDVYWAAVAASRREDE